MWEQPIFSPIGQVYGALSSALQQLFGAAEFTSERLREQYKSQPDAGICSSWSICVLGSDTGESQHGRYCHEDLKNPIFAIIPAVNLMILSVTVCGNADSLPILPPGQLNHDYTSIPSWPVGPTRSHKFADSELHGTGEIASNQINGHGFPPMVFLPTWTRLDNEVVGYQGAGCISHCQTSHVLATRAAHAEFMYGNSDAPLVLWFLWLGVCLIVCFPHIGHLWVSKTQKSWQVLMSDTSGPCHFAFRNSCLMTDQKDSRHLGCFNKVRQDVYSLKPPVGRCPTYPVLLCPNHL